MPFLCVDNMSVYFAQNSNRSLGRCFTKMLAISQLLTCKLAYSRIKETSLHFLNFIDLHHREMFCYVIASFVS